MRHLRITDVDSTEGWLSEQIGAIESSVDQTSPV